MIGIGTWQTSVNAMLFKGDITIVVSNKDGVYDIDFQLPDKFKDVKIRTYDIVEDGNTLRGKGEVTMLPGKELEAEVTFTSDTTFEGVLNIPFLKRSLPLKNGHKISD